MATAVVLRAPRFISLLFRIVGMIALILSIPAVGAGDSDAPIPKPEVKVGDRWVYRTHDVRFDRPSHLYSLTVTFVGPNRIMGFVERSDKSGEIEVSFSPEWGALANDSGLISTPAQGQLQFPLKVGATYKAAWESKAKQGSTFGDTFGVKVEQTVKVIGWEEVVVPAGKFRALRVESEGSFARTDRSFGGPLRYTYWYVPEIERWVKYYWEDGASKTRYELVDFKLQ